MTANFLLNNEFTFADKKLKNWNFVFGLASFYVICSIGAIANVSVASWIFGMDRSLYFAGILGALMSMVFNYAVSRAITWRWPLLGAVDNADDAKHIAPDRVDDDIRGAGDDGFSGAFGPARLCAQRHVQKPADAVNDCCVERKRGLGIIDSDIVDERQSVIKRSGGPPDLQAVFEMRAK
eukprot:gene8418-11240_t